MFLLFVADAHLDDWQRIAIGQPTDDSIDITFGIGGKITLSTARGIKRISFDISNVANNFVWTRYVFNYAAIQQPLINALANVV